MGKKRDERGFILECIELYKNLPALWDVKSNEYRNRLIKNKAYEVLLAKYKKRYPNATRDDLTKKFNSLRTNYRKELKKIRELKKNAIDEGQIETTLWYFNEMSFLRGQDGTNSLYNIEPMEEQEESSYDEYTQEGIPKMESLDDQEESSYDNTQTFSENQNIEGFNYPYKKNSQDEIRDRFKIDETEYDKISKAWAVELAKMDSIQQIHAKKAINDILYEGQLGNLYKNCVQIYPPPSLSTPPEYR